MTRQLTSTRRTMTRVVERDRSPPRAGTPVEDDMTVVQVVIDTLTDEVTEHCMTAIGDHLHSVGLRGGLGDGHDLRAATREYVLGVVMGTLRERLDHPKTLPDVLVRLRVSKTVERLLIEYPR